MVTNPESRRAGWDCLKYGYVLCCWERIFPIGGGSLLWIVLNVIKQNRLHQKLIRFRWSRSCLMTRRWSWPKGGLQSNTGRRTQRSCVGWRSGQYHTTPVFTVNRSWWCPSYIRIRPRVCFKTIKVAKGGYRRGRQQRGNKELSFHI